MCARARRVSCATCWGPNRGGCTCGRGALARKQQGASARGCKPWLFFCASRKKKNFKENLSKKDGPARQRLSKKDRTCHTRLGARLAVTF